MDNILTYALIGIVPLIIGWVLDLLFGDPERLPHPIVWFGKWIAFWEKRLNHGSFRKVKGSVFAVVSILLTFLGGKVLLSAAWHWQVFGLLSYIAVQSILIFYCLAGHTLRREVRMVFDAVDHSVEEGRTQVARIVGRDTSELSPQEIRTAALETLAENLSDGVIAPVFWFFLLGVPGMLMYKMINTLDSMIGYQNDRYKDFGCWAAHIDDVANYIPARISALLIIIASKLIRPKSLQPDAVGADGAQSSSHSHRTLRELLSFTVFFGPQHASPNSGWPESALAGVLDCRFGGPHNYFGEYFYKPYIGDNPRQLTTADMRLSIRITLLAEIIFVAVIVAWLSTLLIIMK